MPFVLIMKDLNTDQDGGEQSALSILSDALTILKKPPPTMPRRPTEASKRAAHLIDGDKIASSSEYSAPSSPVHNRDSPGNVDVEERSSGSDSEGVQSPLKDSPLQFPRRASLSDYLGMYIVVHSPKVKACSRQPFRDTL